MKNYFLFAMLLLIPLAIFGWFLLALGRALYTLFDDWRLGKELDELRADSQSRRERLRLASDERLNTGCQHDFDADVFGFPPGVCSKCGQEKEKPAGSCDHVWRLVKGAIPSSQCEKCGKTHSATTERGNLR